MVLLAISSSGGVLKIPFASTSYLVARGDHGGQRVLKAGRKLDFPTHQTRAFNVTLLTTVLVTLFVVVFFMTLKNVFRAGQQKLGVPTPPFERPFWTVTRAGQAGQTCRELSRSAAARRSSRCSVASPAWKASPRDHRLATAGTAVLTTVTVLVNLYFVRVSGGLLAQQQLDAPYEQPGQLRMRGTRVSVDAGHETPARRVNHHSGALTR